MRIWYVQLDIDTAYPAGQLRSRDFPGPIILRISTKHQFYMIEQPSHTVVVASRWIHKVKIRHSSSMAESQPFHFLAFELATAQKVEKSKSYCTFSR